VNGGEQGGGGDAQQGDVHGAFLPRLLQNGRGSAFFLSVSAEIYALYIHIHLCT
jgi:hypothetical protein